MEETRRTTTAHTYPADLAALVRERWDGGAIALPPDQGTLETLISTCYQASLLREEERSVTFRAILCDPSELPPLAGPPDGVHVLEFASPRPFDIQEVRRLSPAADYYRSLIGVGWDEEEGLRIWGLVHSGPRWLRADQGGRLAPPPLPQALVLRVQGPGRIAVDAGGEMLAKLDEGNLSDASLDVFASRWLPDAFAPVRGEIAEIHAAYRDQAREKGEIWARLDNDVIRVIGQHTVKRIISAVRDSCHGATVVIVPPDLADDILEGQYVSLKYRFTDAEPRRRFRSLIVDVMNTLARSSGGKLAERPVGWEDYAASDDEALVALDEAIFEVAHLIAGLTAVDGAFVMTQRFELLGFGGEISGGLPDVGMVAKALDTEANATVEESTDGVGTRHRSAYRLCKELCEVITVVISQDGNVRFVKCKDGAVTYWDQA
ncbi:MAG: diadenylate cyclase [Actinomycetota bacterium]|nr:diadenylate cyclase [Actinomycetota bacterium]